MRSAVVGICVFLTASPVLTEAGPVGAEKIGAEAIGTLERSPEGGTGPTDFEIAFAHAPVHFQDTDSSRPRADYVTRFDYDGNWRANDNWDHLGRHSLPAHVYYSVVATCTHWFVIYAFFHPQDWTDESVDQEHENDMEGVLAVIRKQGPAGPALGRLEAIVTTAHADFYSYVPTGSPLKNGTETVDGKLTIATYSGMPRMKTAQEAKGHGLKAWPFAGDFDGGAGQDGIIYYPSKDTAEIPSSGNDRSVKYRLESFFAPGGLWQRQLEEADRIPSQATQTTTYAQWGAFWGDTSSNCGSGISVTCSENSASPGWRWDDEDDGPVIHGEMALDPAHLVGRYFSGLGTFGTEYLSNRYVSDLKAKGWGKAVGGRPAVPRGWPAALDLNALYGKLITRCG